jgi:hypothetical protein
VREPGLQRWRDPHHRLHGRRRARRGVGTHQRRPAGGRLPGHHQPRAQALRLQQRRLQHQHPPHPRRYPRRHHRHRPRDPQRWPSARGVWRQHEFPDHGVRLRRRRVQQRHAAHGRVIQHLCWIRPRARPRPRRPAGDRQGRQRRCRRAGATGALRGYQLRRREHAHFRSGHLRSETRPGDAQQRPALACHRRRHCERADPRLHHVHLQRHNRTPGRRQLLGWRLAGRTRVAARAGLPALHCGRRVLPAPASLPRQLMPRRRKPRARWRLRRARRQRGCRRRAQRWPRRPWPAPIGAHSSSGDRSRRCRWPRG